MLTFGEARRGFESYLEKLGISPDLCSYYSRAVYRRVLVQLLHRLPCSRYRSLAAHDFMTGPSDSVGVARQYSGTLGKVGNCQVAYGQ